MKKNILITGATGGIGKATAMQLAKENCRLTILSRNESKLKEVKREIVAYSGNTDVSILTCDLSSLSSIRKAVKAFGETNTHLDVLVNNAGVSPGTRLVTKDGFEMNFGVNHLAPFLLTNLLLPLLKKGENSRIVIVASDIYTMGKRDLNDLNWESKVYQMMPVYATSKLYNLYFMLELAERLKANNITVNALHPGVVKSSLFDTATGFMGLFNRIAGALFYTTPENGAKTSIYLALSKEVAKTTGKYFKKSKSEKIKDNYLDPEFQKELWRISEQLVGLSKSQ